MTFDQIERALGTDVVAGVQSAVVRAYIASRKTATRNGALALQELLIVLLSATIKPQKDLAAAQHCITSLRQTVLLLSDDQKCRPV
jgi:hypothetical protein